MNGRFGRVLAGPVLAVAFSCSCGSQPGPSIVQDTVGESRAAEDRSQQDQECAPQCDGRQCGPDHCGGTCGKCNPWQVCSDAGLCSPVQCKSSKECPSGLVCALAVGQCVPCEGDEDCGAEETCGSDYECHVLRDCGSDKDCTGFGMVCDKAAGRCVECNSVDDCPEEQHCEDARCVDTVCPPGSVWCAGSVSTVCSADGKSIESEEDCAESGLSCVDGNCLALICVPDEVSCADVDTRQLCSPDGLEVAEEDCPGKHSCTDGVCLPWQCEPGTATCNGDIATVCDEAGLGPKPGGTPCNAAGESCVEGHCVACAPDCINKECGPDGCGDQCGSCDDVDPCTNDECEAGKCAHTPSGLSGCCIVPYFKDDFSTDKGWAYSKWWERGSTMKSEWTPNGFGDPAIDHTSSDDNFVAGQGLGTNVGAAGDYYDHEVKSPPINTQGSKNLKLTYYRWLNSAPYDAEIFIFVWHNGTWYTVWEAPDYPPIQDDHWVFQSFDIQDFSSGEVQFWFTSNVFKGAAGGWNIDDVQVFDAAAMSVGTPLCCDYLSDCDGIYEEPQCVAGMCLAQ